MLNFISNFKRILNQVSRSNKLRLILLVILIFFTALIELLSIGSVVPFLSLLTNPEIFNNSQILQFFLNSFDFLENFNILLLSSILFSGLVIIAAVLRFSLLWASSKLSFSIGADISNKIFSINLNNDYLIHCSRNSSEVIDQVLYKSDTFTTVINMYLNILSSLIISFILLGTIIILNPLIALISLIFFVFFYLIILLKTKRILHKNSQIISFNSIKVLKILQEGLGGIRNVLIDSTQNYFTESFKNADISFRKVQLVNIMISAFPKFVLEPIGIITIVTIALYLINNNNNTNPIPLLGLLAMGTQRLLPILQQTYSALTYIKGVEVSFNSTLLMLEEYKIKPPLNLSLSFTNKIELKSINFNYPSVLENTLSDINLIITKGSKIGIIGSTGCGKSTLIDIIIGLISPNSGSLLVDGNQINYNNKEAWFQHISHVPQSIFLSDNSVLENIAFGVAPNLIDIDRVKYAANKAKLSIDIDSWPEKYDTRVGERGVLLSGGQRQRIGIARAFYKKSDFLILDEATSALDNNTEDEVMNSIDFSDSKMTVIIIAHRISTLKNCSKIVEIESGRIKKIGQFKDFFN
jgi:ABC-type multidrug transport system fused ATPase/permease subunit